MPPPRQYRMVRRAEQVDDTRRRIVEATVALHGSVGPAGTTVAGIAEVAGVTRATVYAHFPDDDSLFSACSAHWLAQRHPPDPGAWAQVADPHQRLRVGLADLYRFYRDGESMLSRIYRDRAVIPERHRRNLDERDDAFCQLLLAPFGDAGVVAGLRRAVLGHAISFWTWRSLCVDHGLADEVAVHLMVRLVTELPVAGTRRRTRRAGATPRDRAER